MQSRHSRHSLLKGCRERRSGLWPVCLIDDADVARWCHQTSVLFRGRFGPAQGFHLAFVAGGDSSWNGDGLGWEEGRNMT